jgi:hypothetical protein
MSKGKHKKHPSPSKGSQKTFASERTINLPGEGSHNAPAGGAPLQQHDALNRQGSFETAGEHARTGNRGHQ